MEGQEKKTEKDFCSGRSLAHEDNAGSITTVTSPVIVAPKVPVLMGERKMADAGMGKSLREVRHGKEGKMRRGQASERER